MVDRKIVSENGYILVNNVKSTTDNLAGDKAAPRSIDNIHTGRLLELDALRGIAALSVMVYHYTVRYDQIYGSLKQPLFQFTLGEYGVQLFFMVSGFVIFLTLDRTRHAADFVFSRFSRLYPVYWAAIFVTFFATTYGLPDRAVSIETAIVNLTMLQQWFGFKSVDGVYWTLAVELSFYFIMFFLYSTRLIRFFHCIIVLWLLVIVGAEVSIRHFSLHIPWIIEQALLLKHGTWFIAGMVFYRLMKNKNLDSPLKCACQILLLSATAAIELYLNPDRLLVVMIFYMIFSLFIYHKLGFLAILPLTFLGNISYGLYLIHQNIGYMTIQFLLSMEVDYAILLLIMPISVSIIIAVLLYRYIEKPSLRLMRGWWKNSSIRNKIICNPG